MLHIVFAAAVRRMRTRVGLLVQPESMRSSIDATQREQWHGLSWNWGVSRGGSSVASEPT